MSQSLHGASSISGKLSSFDFEEVMLNQYLKIVKIYIYIFSKAFTFDFDFIFYNIIRKWFRRLLASVLYLSRIKSKMC